MSRTTTLKNLVKLTLRKKALAISQKVNKYGPSDLVIAGILNYSKSLSIRETNYLGTIELLLN
jgi:hypothetical protein